MLYRVELNTTVSFVCSAIEADSADEALDLVAEQAVEWQLCYSCSQGKIETDENGYYSVIVGEFDENVTVEEVKK